MKKIILFAVIISCYTSYGQLGEVAINDTNVALSELQNMTVPVNPIIIDGLKESNLRAPCSEIIPSDPLVNQAYYSSDGPSAPGQILATDITVPADTDFTLNTVIPSTWVLTGASNIATAEIMIFGDAGGIPDVGNVIYSQSGIVPTIQTETASGATYTVYDVEFDLGGQLLAGQTGVATTYWISVYFSTIDGGDAFWERSKSVLIGNIAAYSPNGGVTWQESDFPFDMVYSFLGDCNPVLSVEENLQELVSIYPNPAISVLNVDLPSNIEVINISLYDLLGKKSNVHINERYSLDFSALPSGVYVLVLETSEGTLNKRVIKH